MGEVGPTKLQRANERVAQSSPLDQRRRHDQADEREPRNPGEHEGEREERKRQVDENAGQIRARARPAPDRHVADDSCGDDVREREHRRARDRKQIPVVAAQLCGDDAGDARPHADGKGPPEVVLVDADRLGDQLADRPRLGR